MKKLLNIHPTRTSFAQDIIADVFLPEKQTGKIAILAGGLPSSPTKSDTLRFLSALGYVAIFFRYRGSWESKGNFLKHSPAKDIEDIISDLKTKKKLYDVFSQKFTPIKVSSIHLFGSSFGGPAVILNSKNPLVKKVIALSPVLDWQTLENGSEPSSSHFRFIEEGYGGAYRVEKNRDWKKLLRPDFYNPLTCTHQIDGKKVMIIHAKDDTIVSHTTLDPFAQTTGATFYLKPKGGHFGLRDMTQKFLWKKIAIFLRS